MPPGRWLAGTALTATREPGCGRKARLSCPGDYGRGAMPPRSRARHATSAKDENVTRRPQHGVVLGGSWAGMLAAHVLARHLESETTVRSADECLDLRAFHEVIAEKLSFCRTSLLRFVTIVRCARPRS